jgi:hypothetical protein
MIRLDKPSFVRLASLCVALFMAVSCLGDPSEVGFQPTDGQDTGSDDTHHVGQDAYVDLDAATDVSVPDTSTPDATEPDTAESDITQDSGDIGGEPDVVYPESCRDEEKNGQETDTDCGGPDCPPCAQGQACLGDDDCAPVVYGSWGPCEVPDSGICAESGVKRRSVTSYSCSGDKICVAQTGEQIEPCSRPTQGDSCGDDLYGQWGECQYTNKCETTGVKQRPATTYTCDSGDCVSNVGTDTTSEGCVRDTAGESCGSDECGPFSACQYDVDDTCSETGIRTQTCQPRVCQNGACGYGTSYTVSEACNRTTTGNACTGSDPCSSYTCGNGSCVGAARCAGTVSSCGCTQCQACPANGWYDVATGVDCCNGTGQKCTCTLQELREYRCENYGCAITVTSTRYVQPTNCAACTNEVQLGTCAPQSSDIASCTGTRTDAVYGRTCPTGSQTCELSGTATVVTQSCVMPDGSGCLQCSDPSLCPAGLCSNGTCLTVQTCFSGLVCRSNADCPGGYCGGFNTCVCTS